LGLFGNALCELVGRPSYLNPLPVVRVEPVNPKPRYVWFSSAMDIADDLSGNTGDWS
jgi:hypothetical protein